MLYLRYLSLRCSDIAHVNEGSQFYLPFPHFYAQVKWAISAFTPSCIASLYFGQYSFPIPLRIGSLVVLVCWAGFIPRWFAHLKMLTYPGTISTTWSNCKATYWSAQCHYRYVTPPEKVLKSAFVNWVGTLNVVGTSCKWMKQHIWKQICGLDSRTQ